MTPIFLLLAIAGLLLVMLTLIFRRYFAGNRNARPARRRRLASASRTGGDSDIAPLGLFASNDAGDDDAAGDSGESDNRGDAGGSGAQVGGGEAACWGADDNVTGSDMGSTDACGG